MAIMGLSISWAETLARGKDEQVLTERRIKAGLGLSLNKRPSHYMVFINGSSKLR